MSKATFDPNVEVSAAALGKFLGNISRKRVEQLAAEGIIPRKAKGKFPLLAGVLGHREWEKSSQRRASKSAVDDALKASKQKEIDLRIAEREGRLVDWQDAEAAINHILGAFRAELSGVGAAVTRDRELRGKFDKALDDALARSRDRFAKARSDLRAGRDPFAADGEDDT